MSYREWFKLIASAVSISIVTTAVGLGSGSQSKAASVAALIFRLLSLLNQAVNVSFCLAGRALAIILDAASILVAQINGPFPPPSGRAIGPR